MSNSTALIRDLLLNPSPENHLEIMRIIDDEKNPLLLDYVQEHLKEWDVEWKNHIWENHIWEDVERFSSPLIRKLNCDDNDLTSLPENLENLEILYCSYNNLTQLPENLENLEVLYCDENKLTQLPENLENLKVLWCDENELTQLPENLENLKVLWCDENNLTSLPDNLGNLERLYCRGNPFPEGYLEEIQRKYPQLEIFA
jgi:Leucine-rich repeat (LRR) protein